VKQDERFRIEQITESHPKGREAPMVITPRRFARSINQVVSGIRKKASRRRRHD